MHKEKEEEEKVWRDLRRHEKFGIDHDFIGAHSRSVGIAAVAVYAILCKFAGQGQAVRVPLPYMAWPLGTSERTVMRAVNRLERLDMIAVIRGFDSARRRRVNTYLLLDRKLWKTPSHVTDCHPAQGEPCDILSQVDIYIYKLGTKKERVDKSSTIHTQVQAVREQMETDGLLAPDNE